MRTVFLSMCAMAALVAALWVSPVQAADVTVTATILSVSVSVTSGSPVAFGIVAASSTTRSTVAAVIANDGNVNETYSLSLTDPVADWTAAATAGANEYVLSAMFSTAAPGATFGAEDVLALAPPVACTATVFGNTVAGESGLVVPMSEARNLWLEFKAPTTTSSYAQKTITVTITADAS
ncbi:MAG: hypothetical protein NT028_08370 [candidate division Zixibacteria bacterium]|nr:hypothetical protein [candidate division Zixibacteria bacterium]